MPNLDLVKVIAIVLLVALALAAVVAAVELVSAPSSLGTGAADVLKSQGESAFGGTHGIAPWGVAMGLLEVVTGRWYDPSVGVMIAGVFAGAVLVTVAVYAFRFAYRLFGG